MTAAGKRTLVALVLQLAAAAALVAALFGLNWLDARSRQRLVVLVDRSDSMPQPAVDRALAQVVLTEQGQGRAPPLMLEFAGKPAAAGQTQGAAGSPAPAALEPWATDIESALRAVLALHARQPLAGVVVVSDGHANAGDTVRGLRALRAAGLPVSWRPVARPPPDVRIAEVLAPTRARSGQPIEIGVRLAGAGARALRVEVTARGAAGQSRSGAAASDASGQARITLDAGADGPLVVDLALKDAGSGDTLERRPDAAVIDIVAGASLLYARGRAAPLAQALRRGGWALDEVPAARLDAHADGLEGYQAVVLDDVAVSDAGPRFWQALTRAVNERGLGLLVLGGERSFARGGYRGSLLESVLPVTAEPAALDQPAQLLFVVDKSGSMGSGSAGVDRFALARRAVVETARSASDRDAVGLLVFDVAPRLLLPLAPVASARPVLERDWPVAPNGGTQLAPALDAAIGQLERAGPGRRLLVLVTDGFVDNAPLAGLQARLERARIEIVALAVGPDADAGALERAIGESTGVVLAVGEAAELPQAMRSGVERRRARVQRGHFAVRQRAPLPFAPSAFADWPPLAAYAVTRSRPEAEVLLESPFGEPVLAAWRSGLGPVLALTGGLGAWSARWLEWQHWPRLAGGMAEAVAGGGAFAGAHAVTVTELATALRLEADLAAPSLPAGRTPLSITVDTPAARRVTLGTEWAAPGRLRAAVADAGPGLYTFVLAGPGGTQRHLHLRQRGAESRDWGTNPSLRDWAIEGLVTTGAADQPAATRPESARRLPPDRSLIGLALVLFVMGVVIDRAGIERAGPRLTRLRRRFRGT